MFTVLKSFSGKVSGSKGHVIELKDKAIISDLLKDGYIEEYTEKNKIETGWVTYDAEGNVVACVNEETGKVLLDGFSSAVNVSSPSLGGVVATVVAGNGRKVVIRMRPFM